MVVVEQGLLLGVLKVALRHRIHVVEAEVLVLGLEEGVYGGVAGHHLHQVEAVLHFGGAPHTSHDENQLRQRHCVFDARHGQPAGIALGRHLKQALVLLVFPLFLIPHGDFSLRIALLILSGLFPQPEQLREPFLVLLGIGDDPAVIELIADIALQEVDPLDLVPFGQTQHLPAEFLNNMGLCSTTYPRH